MRPTHLQNALLHLQKATKLDPSSSTAFYQLALVQSALRQAGAAVISARTVVELAPKDLRAWHLLALLLTAEEEWDNACQIIEHSISKTEESSEAGPSMIGTGNGYAMGSMADSEGDHADSATPPASTSPEIPTAVSASSDMNFPVIEGRSEKISSPVTLQYGLPSIPFVSKFEKFESSIQLLLTQLAIIERVEGAESANEKWPDVFKFFSTHCSSGPAVLSQRRIILPSPCHCTELTIYEHNDRCVS